MKTLTRDQLIDEIRRAALLLVDDDHSFCEVTGRLGIHCRGFKQYTDEELQEKYLWLARDHGATTRAEVEDLANRWQLARQLVSNEELSCDVQAREHDTCLGWDGYSDEYLAELHARLCGGDTVQVAAQEA